MYSCTGLLIYSTKVRWHSDIVGQDSKTLPTFRYSGRVDWDAIMQLLS